MNKKLSKALEEMVNVCDRKMNINDLNNNMRYYMLKSPSLMVVTIERKEGGYHSTIYINKKDLKRKYSRAKK